MPFNVGAIVARLRLDVSDFSTGIKNATYSARKFEKDMLGSAAAFQRLGVGITGVGVAAAAGFVNAAQEAARFQAEIANVSTVVDTSSVNMAAMQAQLLMLPSTLGDAAGNAKALYEALSSNIDPAKAVRFVGDAALFAKAGLTSTMQAVDVLTSIIGAYGMQAEDATKISDKLFETVRLGKITAEELSASVGQVTPIAAAAGVSLDDLLASVAALTMTGLSGSESLTGIRSAISDIIKPSIQTQKVAQALGIEFNAVALETKGLKGFLSDLRDRMEELKDPTKAAALQAQVCGVNFEKLYNKSGQLTKEGRRLKLVFDGLAEGNVTAAFAQLFGSVEALNAVMSLTGNQFETFKNDQAAIAGAIGTTQVAADKQKEAVSQLWQAWMNSLNKTAIIIGQMNEGPLAGLLKSLNSMTEGFNTLMQQNGLLAKGIIVTTGAITALTIGAGGMSIMISILPRLVEQWKILQSVFGTVAKAANGATAALVANQIAVTGVSNASVLAAAKVDLLSSAFLRLKQLGPTALLGAIGTAAIWAASEYDKTIRKTIDMKLALQSETSARKKAATAAIDAGNIASLSAAEQVKALGGMADLIGELNTQIEEADKLIKAGQASGQKYVPLMSKAQPAGPMGDPVALKKSLENKKAQYVKILDDARKSIYKARKSIYKEAASLPPSIEEENVFTPGTSGGAASAAKKQINEIALAIEKLRIDAMQDGVSKRLAMNDYEMKQELLQTASSFKDMQASTAETQAAMTLIKKKHTAQRLQILEEERDKRKQILSEIKKERDSFEQELSSSFFPASAMDDTSVKSAWGGAWSSFDAVQKANSEIERITRESQARVTYNLASEKDKQLIDLNSWLQSQLQAIATEERALERAGASDVDIFEKTQKAKQAIQREYSQKRMEITQQEGLFSFFTFDNMNQLLFSSLDTALGSMITSQKTFNEVVANLWQNLADQIIGQLLRISAQWLATKALNFLFPGLGFSGGGVVPESDNPTSSFFPGAVAGAAGMIVPGTGTMDSVPAMLKPKEMVLPTEISIPLMDMLKRPGSAGERGQNTSGGVVQNVRVNQRFTGPINADSKAQAAQIGRQLASAFNRRVRQATGA